MQKVILSIVGLVIGIILLTTMLPDTITDATTEAYSENYDVTTAGGVTETTETLSYAHWYGDLRELDATTDNENDTPVVMSYDEDSYEVTVDGLEASASRILTVDYVREAHSEFTGFSSFLRLLPFIGIVGLVVAALWGLFSHMRG
ncbi:MAG TPA: hypothetical protein VMW50_13590 [Dehalococcoidia bacterium]|nr:hypothetical protein [Dehalococcoidia bacterium]